MKRSKHVYLKRNPRQLKTGLKLSAIAAGGIALTGCGSEEAYIYQNAYECSLDNPGYDQQCESAYQRALRDWDQTAPRYRESYECEYDFGAGQCNQYTPYYIPAMTGFMLGNNYRTDDDFDLDFDRPKALSSSRMRHSPAYNRWVGADGMLFGSLHKNRVKVSPSTFKSSFKGTKGSAKIMGRGGFGSSVSSRSFGG